MPELIFVDSSAFVALMRSDDAKHEEAMQILANLTRERAFLITSNYVVAETHALALRYVGYLAARRYLQEIENNEAAVMWMAEPQDERAARQIIYRYSDKDFSLADAISFAMIERLSIRRAFTFDRHFAQYGFQVLTAT